MDRLSGLDASFLYLETPAQLMHVCGVIVLDPSTMPGGYSFDALQSGIDEKIRDVPEFTRKLRRVPLGLDHPVWVRDKQFDIERHVHRLALPTPGGYRELMDLVGHLAGLPLDRSRPNSPLPPTDSGGASASRLHRWETRLAPETPSTVAWCILEKTTILSASNPSITHISHSGRDRSRGRPARWLVSSTSSR